MGIIYKNSFYQSLYCKARNSFINHNRSIKKLHKITHVNISRLLELENQDKTTGNRIIISSRTAIPDIAWNETINSLDDKSPSNYNAVIAIFLDAPRLEIITIPTFNYWEGQSITFKATDDFKVEQVIVAIYNNYGNLMEKGNAQTIDAGMQWTYNSTAKYEQFRCITYEKE
jgi:hypothetical protein